LKGSKLSFLIHNNFEKVISAIRISSIVGASLFLENTDVLSAVLFFTACKQSCLTNHVLMKADRVLFFLLIVFAPFLQAWVFAGDEENSALVTADISLSAYEQLRIAALSSDDESFQKAVDHARAEGVSEACIVQCSAVFCLGTKNLDALFEMIEPMEIERASMVFGPGELFVSDREFGAFILSLKAMQSFNEDNRKGFEMYAMQSYLEDPRWVERMGITRRILDLRETEVRVERMKTYKVSFDTLMLDLEGQKVRLGDLMQNRRALLINFWASWSPACLEMMPRLKELAQELDQQGVAVIALNAEPQDESTQQKIIEVRAETAQTIPWLIEMADQKLGLNLMVSEIPRWVVVGPTGRVIFNGVPDAPGLKAVWAKMGINVEPTIAVDGIDKTTE
jgi:thiol-disulfide isomerase/thioredoxin